MGWFISRKLYLSDILPKFPLLPMLLFVIKVINSKILLFLWGNSILNFRIILPIFPGFHFV